MTTPRTVIADLCCDAQCRCGGVVHVEQHSHHNLGINVEALHHIERRRVLGDHVVHERLFVRINN